LPIGTTPDNLPHDGIKPQALRIVRVFISCQATKDRLPKQSGPAVLDIFARALIHNILASDRSQPESLIEFPVE
jgi:hypothetical protein|tara:strand:- start:323 stop:544 length:222 start_codon:yes stop_codon:yes gene_type:complete